MSKLLFPSVNLCASSVELSVIKKIKTHTENHREATEYVLYRLILSAIF